MPAPRGLCSALRSRTGRNDLEFGDRDHELSVPLTYIRQLRDNFVFQVPGEDEHIVRLRFPEFFWSKDRDMGTGSKFAMLIGIPVYDVLDEVGAYTAVVQQSVRLAWGTIPGDR